MKSFKTMLAILALGMGLSAQAQLVSDKIKPCEVKGQMGTFNEAKGMFPAALASMEVKTSDTQAQVSFSAINERFGKVEGAAAGSMDENGTATIPGKIKVGGQEKFALFKIEATSCEDDGSCWRSVEVYVDEPVEGAFQVNLTGQLKS